MKVFLDTNVLASSIATRGLCAELMERVLHEHELLISEAVLLELGRVLAEKLRVPEPVGSDFLDLLKTEARLVEAGPPPRVRIKDSADLAVLGGAIAGQADVFVTGDKELLDLRRIGSMDIVSPRDLWIRLAGLEGRSKP